MTCNPGTVLVLLVIGFYNMHIRRGCRVAQNVQTSFADSAKRNPGTLGPEVSKNTFFVNFEACPDMPVEL